MSSIGRYEIEAEIGRGAMGVVYLAHDPRLGRRVAVKTYHVPEGFSDEQRAEFRQRFVREAQAAARLSHPAIVTIFDAEEGGDEGRPWISMEFVPGRSLAEILASDGALPLEEACTLAAAAARGLQAAHHEGIVHRDVKPANLLVRDGDRAMKIADFGIARFASSELTRSGETLGSPAYMSPEQIRGATLDGRSDLFSLAVILYEMISGDRPFAGDDPSTLVYAIVHSSPLPISERVKDLPEWLERFFRQALAKAPDDRFQDGNSFAEALEQRGTDTMVLPAMTVADPDSRRIGTGEIAPDPHALDRGGLDVSLDPFPVLEEEPPDGKRRGLRRAPLLAVLALVLGLGGWVMLGGSRDAYLRLDGRSDMGGQLTVLIDGEERYARDLAGPRRKARGLGKLKKMIEPAEESFETWIELRPGKHEIEARVEAGDDEDPFRDSIVVDLEPGEKRRLRLVAGRSFGKPLSLKLD